MLAGKQAAPKPPDAPYTAEMQSRYSDVRRSGEETFGLPKPGSFGQIVVLIPRTSGILTLDKIHHEQGAVHALWCLKRQLVAVSFCCTIVVGLEKECRLGAVGPYCAMDTT